MTYSIEARQIMAEISGDIVSNNVSREVRTFVELHDDVDANEYVEMIRPQRDDEDHDAYMKVVNALESEVDQWLRAGRPAADMYAVSGEAVCQGCEVAVNKKGDICPHCLREAW